MSERKSLIRIAAAKSSGSDGVGNFYGEYQPDQKYYPRLELRFVTGSRISIAYSDITEINYAHLVTGNEDITLHATGRYIIRIVGKELGKLFDSLHLGNVLWVREVRDGEQFAEKDCHVLAIIVHYIDNWEATLTQLEDIAKAALEGDTQP